VLGKGSVVKGRLRYIGILLGFLGGAVSILQSGIVMIYAFERGYQFGRFGLVGFGIAVFILVGAVMFYEGHMLLGALLMFFSSLVGQLVGGAIGFILATPTWPTSPVGTIYNMDFSVSAWTLFSLVGSVLLLFALWRSRKK